MKLHLNRNAKKPSLTTTKVAVQPKDQRSDQKVWSDWGGEWMLDKRVRIPKNCKVCYLPPSFDSGSVK